MDDQTIKIYNQNASQLADEYSRSVPVTLHRLIDRHFVVGGATIDIGSGSGRELAFMKSRGFTRLMGCDASKEMLEKARVTAAGVELIEESLPELKSIQSAHYDNVLCSAVLMHVPAYQTSDAITNLMRVLKTRGKLIVSFRKSRGSFNREDDGRLFTPLKIKEVIQLFEAQGASLKETVESERGEAGRVWDTLVFEKN